MEKDHHIYLGIVLQNNDPEMRGRIKIYIPQLSPTVNGVEVGDNKNVDKFFNFLGTNNETSNEITENIQTLKNILPWAEYAGPICGGNASGRYNATLKTGTTSDANTWENGTVTEGFRPAQNFISDVANPDAFTQTGVHKNKFVNEYSYQYTPSNYSGFARGLFSIPNVGAHVYLFFLDGDRNFPIYFASSYSREDIKRIFTLDQDVDINTNMDYPATYENINTNNPDNTNTKTFRSKTVLNSNKHTIELIDTDLHEILKLTHYSGSFKEFNSYANIELATKNDQKLVKGDQFLTVELNQSQYIKEHRELIVGGDHYVNIGETDYTKVQAILNIHKEIHDYKMLFDIQRAQYGETPNNVSTKQIRSGYPELCPVCKGVLYDPYDPSYGGDPSKYWKEAPKYIKDVCIATPKTIPQVTSETESTQKDPIFFTPDCHSIYLPGVSEVEMAKPNSICKPIQHPNKGRKGYYRGALCACCNGATLRQMRNPGYSPSTEKGTWSIESAKTKNGALDLLIKNKTPELFKLEKELGLGGDEIKTISMNKIETIGLVMNDMCSFRVDPIGKLKIDGCWVAPQGTYENFRPSPHVEYVDVADIPGGDYILTCMNKYKLLVGSRGVNIQTTGPIDIYGSIANFTAEQFNISSKNEIVIDGGERLTLRARKITVLPVEHNALVVEGLLHVTRNMIIEGGTMLEGEVGLLHITAPVEWHKTEPGLWDFAPSMVQAPGVPCTMTAMIKGVLTDITLPNHVHWFKNMPMTLVPHKEAVRETMISRGINSRNTIAASAPASNPTGNCDDGLFQQVIPAFFAAAFAKANQQYQQQSGNTDLITNIEALNGPNNISCTTTGAITEFRTVYNWYWKDYSSNVSVIGNVQSNGEIIGSLQAV